MFTLLSALLLASLTTSEPTLQIVHNDALPGSMRIGRMLHPDQLLIDAYRNDAGDTAVVVIEMRSPHDTMRIDMLVERVDQHSTGQWSAGGVTVVPDVQAGFPQFRRVIMRHTEDRAMFTSFTVRQGGYSSAMSHGGPVRSYREIDVR